MRDADQTHQTDPVDRHEPGDRHDGRHDDPIGGGGRLDLYDRPPSAAELATWVVQGIDGGETVVLAVTVRLQQQLVTALRGRRLAVGRLIGAHRLLLLPAEVVVAAVTEADAIDPARYDALVGGYLRRAVEHGPVRVVSEITDETVRQLGPAAALRAEEAWSRILTDLDIALLGVGSGLP